MKRFGLMLVFASFFVCVPVFAQTATPTPTGCWDPPPRGSVELKTASPSGEHDVTLNWTDATDPVSYYLLSYGMEPGKYIYGNPNMGGQGTTSYTVGGLTKGKTYYFVVRAGNGCTPGTFSNELSAVAGEMPTPTPLAEPDPAPQETPTPEPPTPAGQSPLGGATPVPEVLAAETSSTAGSTSLLNYIMLGATAFGIFFAVASAILLLRMKRRT